MPKKCCKKKICTPKEPTCVNVPNTNKLWAYFWVFNCFLVVFRLLLLNRAEIDTIPSGFFPPIWWYIKLILVLEFQLFMIYMGYLLTVSTMTSLYSCGMSVLHWLGQLYSVRITNPIMAWLGLIDVDWWGYKIWCVIAVLWFTVGLFFIMGGYAFIVYLFGLNSLGYYRVN